MRLRKTSIALGAALVALSAAGAAESASVGFRRDELRGILLGETAYLFRSQPNAGAPQPSRRALRGTPSMGRGIRGGPRMYGGMRGRR